MAGYFAPMDPNDLLAMAWKWQRGDVSRTTVNFERPYSTASA